MTLFLPGIPQPGDNLDFSQGQLLSNNQGLDAVFGIDHYKFSEVSANKGFHNQVTTPPYVASPPTGNPPITTTNPIFYSFQQTANLGVLQYSRGPANAVPTPVTALQSPSTATKILPAALATVLDFAGINFAMCSLIAFDALVANTSFFAFVTFSNAAAPKFTFSAPVAGVKLVVNASGTTLSVQNNTSPAINLENVYWTLNLYRIQ